MALVNIYKGAAANDGTGTNARNAADILNANFSYLEGLIGLVGTPSTYEKQFGAGAVTITAGANTTPQEICDHINAVGFTVTAGQLILLALTVKKTIAGQAYWYRQKRLFKRNNLVGTWGTSSTNGEIVPADIIALVYDVVQSAYVDSEDNVLIELGNIGSTPIHTYLTDYSGDDLPGITDNILADDGSIYYFNCQAGDVFVTYKYIGTLPKTIGVSTFDIGDFQVFASSGSDDDTPSGTPLPPASKTGTTIEFTEDAYYNKSAFLESGNLTLDFTGAVVGTTVQVFCKGYIPTITGAYYKVSGDMGSTLLNILSFHYNGEFTLLNIGNVVILDASVLSLTNGNTEIQADWTAVPDATNYILEMATDVDFTDATEVYSGALLTHTETGLTNGVEYFFRVKAQGVGNPDSDWSNIESKIPNDADWITGLELALQFEDDVTDYTGNHTASSSVDLSYGTGKIDKCVISDVGLNPRIVFPDDAGLTLTDGVDDIPFTFAMWIKLDTLEPGQNGIIFRKQNEYAVQTLFADDTLTMTLFTDASNNTRRKIPLSTFTAGVWHRVVITYDGSGSSAGIIFYVDKTIVTGTTLETGTYTGMTDTANNVDMLSLGSSQRYDGELDEFYFYKERVWSQLDVDLDYDTQNAGTPTLP